MDFHQDWFVGHEDKVTTQNSNVMHQHISIAITLMTFTNHKNLPGYSKFPDLSIGKIAFHTKINLMLLKKTIIESDYFFPAEYHKMLLIKKILSLFITELNMQ